MRTIPALALGTGPLPTAHVAEYPLRAYPVPLGDVGLPTFGPVRLRLPGAARPVTGPHITIADSDPLHVHDAAAAARPMPPFPRRNV